MHKKQRAQFYLVHIEKNSFSSLSLCFQTVLEQDFFWSVRARQSYQLAVPMEISEESSVAVGFVIVLIAMVTRKKRKWSVHNVMVPVAYVQSQNQEVTQRKVLQSTGKHIMRKYSYKYLINS